MSDLWAYLERKRTRRIWFRRLMIASGCLAFYWVGVADCSATKQENRSEEATILPSGFIDETLVRWQHKKLTRTLKEFEE